MWNPELKMTGEAADTMPARIAAAGRRMPNRTTVANQSSPVVTTTDELLMLNWYDAKNTPPTPAIAAEIANTPSLTRSTDTPDVLAAISDDRVAAMARPHDDRRRLWISNAASPTRMSKNIANVLLLFMSNGPITGRGIVHPDCMLRR